MAKSNSNNTASADCERPACDDVMAMMQTAKAAAAAASQKKKSSTNPTGPSAPPTPKNADLPQKTTEDCPPGSSALGNSSWTLLHSMAAWYPDQPSDRDQRHMTSFMAALARFYPCTWCAKDFATHLQQSPVATQSRTELCQWLCHQHNWVNAKTGKSEFSCDIASLDDRWRRSDRPECQGSSLH